MAEVDSISQTLANSLKESLSSRISEPLTKDPEVDLRPIIFDEHKHLRISAYDKVYVRSFIGLCYLYRTQDDQEKNNYNGCVVGYIKESVAIRLFKELGLIKRDQETTDFLLPASAEFFKGIMEDLIKGLRSAGENVGAASDPIVAVNSIENGIKLPSSIKECHQVVLHYYDMQAVVMDVVIY